MDQVLYRREGAVEVVTLNRPESKNSFSFNMIKELGDHFQRLTLEDDVRAVIITGAGKGFCTGADLTGSDNRPDIILPVGMRLSTQWYSRVVAGIMNLEKPVIGAINGVAAGAGCNLALSCDIIIASEAASFIQVFVRRGLIADMGGTFFLPRLIGLARAKELMFSADEVEARRALELGMINKVVPENELMPAAMELAQRLAHGPTRAIGMIKNMLNRSLESDLESALEREAAMQGIAVSTSDVKEGIVSFFEKRPPDFSGS
ncbi:MAG: enoyl-CoA hydratase-related protein [Deltaproteobacteria bacterium]|nr:enoyl-CoA hydratase-related protein [Deltaproteobacteria bacterium]